VNKMDEIRQQSEATSKKEVEDRAAQNTSEINELRRTHEIALAELEKYIKQECHSLKTDSIDLRMKGDALKETLSTYEDTINKRINTDVMNKIDHLDTLVAEFERNVNSLRSETVSKISSHEEKIINLSSSTEEHHNVLKEHLSSVSTLETRIVSLDQRQKAMAENLLITSEGQLEAMKNQFEGRIEQLVTTTNDQGEVLQQHEEALTQFDDQNRRTNEDLARTFKELEELRIQKEESRGLVVMKFKETNSMVQETRESLESYFKCLETVQSTQTLESTRIDGIERQTESQNRLASQLEDKIRRLEEEDMAQNSKIMDIGTELQTYVNNSQQDFRNMSVTLDSDRTDLWTGLTSLFSAVRGATVVIKSEGALREHQADVIGVYRMVDNFDQRPVYKQDGGENYIYFSARLSSWFVGTVVGHEYGWLRNRSAEAASRTWVPGLSGGWEYRPLVSANTIGHSDWLPVEQGTLEIEALRDVDKVSEVFSDIQQQRSVQ